jgi:hypothetical protein
VKPLRIGIAAALLLNASATPGRAAPARDLRPGPGETLSVGSGHVSDWRLPVPARTIARVSATMRSPHLQARLHAADGRSGNPLWLRLSASGQIPSCQLRITGPPDAKGEVRLWVETEADLDATEPNDAPGSARPLGTGQETTFLLYPEGDLDWFTLHFLAAAEQRVEVRVPGGPGRFREELELGISDSAGFPLAQRIGRAGPDGIWRPHGFDLDPGGYRCWVRVRGRAASREPLVLALPAGPATVRTQPVPAPPRRSATPSAASAPRSAPPPPQVPVPRTDEPEKPAEPRGRSGLLGWGLVAVLGALVVWVIARASRPRRVFDLTR